MKKVISFRVSETQETVCSEQNKKENPPTGFLFCYPVICYSVNLYTIIGENVNILWRLTV
ncbi:hypothetical protein C2H92_14150 [Bacillus halotolerans]|nr:hypothetical protein B9T64_18310 [Bacillus halotolerans]UQZ47681.1 hypothetical protein C2H92_14150 [Bacillus halotolerans]